MFTLLQKSISKFISALTDKERMDHAEGIRIRAALPLIKGKLLDIGCGYNNLVKEYKGDGIGVDVYDWDGKPDMVLKRSDKLPFKDRVFDTVTFIACLNHIPYRISALEEAKRVLKEDGQVIITMIGPTAGKFAHFIQTVDVLERGFMPGELLGLSDKQLYKIFSEAGLVLVRRKRIFPGTNKIYILKKPN